MSWGEVMRQNVMTNPRKKLEIPELTNWLQEYLNEKDLHIEISSKVFAIGVFIDHAEVFEDKPNQVILVNEKYPDPHEILFNDTAGILINLIDLELIEYEIQDEYIRLHLYYRFEVITYTFKFSMEIKESE